MPAAIPNGLAVFKPSADGALHLTAAFRAGALSASFLIVNHASRELLDVDPEEFEVLEPRVKRGALGTPMPVLQIADVLVNGSGLCNRLVQQSEGGSPIVLGIMRRILGNGSGSPLPALLDPMHSRKCLAGCYRCLHRYGNQGYHGLLDWRLGLDVMQLLLNPSYVAGLDGDFSAPGLRDWQSMAHKLADEAASLFQTERKSVAGLPLIGLTPGRWAAVIHPLWDWDSVLSAIPALEEFGLEIGVDSLKPTTTFELSRRMGKVLHDLRTL
jgi:hypothetical protein